MSRPKSYSAPPPPAPPPQDLREVDSELGNLGYKEGQDYRTVAKTQSRQVPISTGGGNPGGSKFVTETVNAVNPNAARITELLGYRSRFLAAEDKVRIGQPKSRAANQLTGPTGLSSSPNLASRVLLG